MIKAEIRNIGKDRVTRALLMLEQKLNKGKTKVLVGVPAGTASSEDGTTMVTIAAANEFGAKIKHPGGTSYGYKTKKDAEEGNVSFLEKGTGYMELGKTGPHEIEIPARPFLHPAIAEGAPVFKRLAEKKMLDVLMGRFTMDQLLNQMGVLGVAMVQEKISSIHSPPNAESTISKKKSSKPLIDTGNLRQSITYIVEDESVKTEEGLQ